MKKSDVVVIIPAFNESAYIAKVLQAVRKTGFSFLVVDDGSTDETAKIAKRHCDHGLVHRVNIGKGLSSMDIFFRDYK